MKDIALVAEHIADTGDDFRQVVNIVYAVEYRIEHARDGQIEQVEIAFHVDDVFAVFEQIFLAPAPKVVDHANAITLRDQFFHQVGPDHAGTAGYQDVFTTTHSNLLREF